MNDNFPKFAPYDLPSPYLKRSFAAGEGLVERGTRGFFKGFEWGSDGALLGAPLIAFEVANAGRGEVIPTAAARTAGLMTYPVMTGVASAAISLIPGIGPVVATILGSVLAMYPNSLLEDGIQRGVRTFTETAKRVRHLEMGGSYIDTESAQRQRFLAVQEMSVSTMPARRYLGQEARLFHR